MTDTAWSHLTRLREAMCASGLGVRARAFGPAPVFRPRTLQRSALRNTGACRVGAIQGYTWHKLQEWLAAQTHLTNLHSACASNNECQGLPPLPVPAHRSWAGSGAAGPRSHTRLSPAASNDSDAVCISQVFLRGPLARLGRAAQQQGLAAARDAVAVRPPPAAHHPCHSKGQAIHLETSSQCTRAW